MSSSKSKKKTAVPPSITTLYRDLEETPTNSSTEMYPRDWRSALRTPPSYRIGNRTLRFNYHIVGIVAGLCSLCLVLIYLTSGSSTSTDGTWLRSFQSRLSSSARVDIQNSMVRYPLSSPVRGRGGTVTYRIAIVADLDTNSKVSKVDGSTVWRSYLKMGYLTYSPIKREVKLQWDQGEPLTLESNYATNGRGMELSELITFNGRLLTLDDRTGIIYEVIKNKAIPWVILIDGDGHNTKGFKAEWATVKDDNLYVGSIGKEWTTSHGAFLNQDPMYVKVVTARGEVRSLDWSMNYKRMREVSLNIKWPGYMIHESAIWSECHNKWFFLPRRCSRLKYNDTLDECMSCNILISADENFTKISSVTLDRDTTTSTTHGFSSFKFIPATDDEVIIALISEEHDGKTATYITAFDIEGHTVLPEQRIDTDFKYEGFEFI